MSDSSHKLGFTLSKAERLSLQSRIDLLFTSGEAFIAYPLRVVYKRREPNATEPSISILASVSKRKFKRAVKRNRVKRLIRENYRLQKYDFKTITDKNNCFIDIAFLYLKDELPEYDEIRKAMTKTISILTERIQTSMNDEKQNS